MNIKHFAIGDKIYFTKPVTDAVKPQIAGQVTGKNSTRLKLMLRYTNQSGVQKRLVVWAEPNEVIMR